MVDRLPPDSYVWITPKGQRFPVTREWIECMARIERLIPDAKVVAVRRIEKATPKPPESITS